MATSESNKTDATTKVNDAPKAKPTTTKLDGGLVRTDR